ncbi:MAG: hypothetical protein AAFY39_10810 [Pseudomonadota bacterium]
MMQEATIAFFSVMVAVAAIWLDVRSKRRSAKLQIETKTRDEARESRLLGLEKRQRKADQEIEDRRFEHAQKLQAMQRLTDWARRATSEMAFADHIMNCTIVQSESTHSSKERIEVAARVSALIDEGRWLFRNHQRDAFGKEKSKLNRGFRYNRLDALVQTYRLLLGDEAIDPMAARKDFAYKVQQLSIPLSEQVLKEQG